MEHQRAEEVLLSIGAVAAATGLSTRQIRYLETAGLLRTARSAGGQRRYTLSDVETARRIAALRRQGKSLRRIARLFAARPAKPVAPIDAGRPEIARFTDAQMYFGVRRGE